MIAGAASDRLPTTSAVVARVRLLPASYTADQQNAAGGTPCESKREVAATGMATPDAGHRIAWLRLGFHYDSV